ncbi:MAG TPA: class I SAM-dependent methyltransferase [Chitinophaga sp.]|uniref:class I SAM-dependent methyltransferase n=1 Tax=Chitinophaga sp. TaxID=1869181 RepID=UPI002F9530D9
MRYVLYFFYLAWYWGLDVAIFIIEHEIRGERRFGVRTIGLHHLPEHLPEQERKHFSFYEPVNYYSATTLFDQLTPADKQTTLLDVGCGRGRVLAIGAGYGFKDMIGIDFSEALCEEAADNAEKVEDRHPGTHITIEWIDARYYDLSSRVGVIFLFNPFDGTVMETFIAKVLQSLEQHPRPMKILYANPQFKHLWQDAGFTESATFVKKDMLRGCVLERP